MSRRHWFGLLLIILLATALRLYRLGAQDLWGDEAFSIFLSSSPLSTVVAGASDTHPPLYPFLLFVWLRLMGSTAFATRALAALTGVVAVPLIFGMAHRLAPTRPRVAWISALLVAISPLLIYYSQETRMYEQVAVLALASSYLFLIAFLPSKESTGDSPGRQYPVWGYVIVTLAAVYTHYSAFFVLAAQNVFFFLEAWRSRQSRGRLARWIAVQAAIIVCYVPWIIVQNSFLRGKASARFEEWGWRGIEMVFGRTLIAFGAGLTSDYPIAQIGATLFLVCAIIGVVIAFRSQDHRLLPFAAACFILPVLIAWVLDPVMPFFYERYVLVALPGFYLLVALGWEAISRRVGPGAWLVAFALLLTSGFSLGQYYYNDAYAKGKYGQMMAYIENQAQPGDAIILNNPLQKPLYDYYQPRGIPAVYLPDGAPLEDPATRQQLADVANGHARVWLVMFGNPAEYDPTGFLERWLGSHAFRTWSRGFVDSALSLYVMPRDSAATIHRPVDAQLGDSVRLVSYELDRDQVAPGQTVQLTLFWQATTPVNHSFKVFTHLLGGLNSANGSPVWAQMDSEPVGGTQPTNQWLVGEPVADRYGLAVPANAPAGDYVLEVGMYDPETLERLPASDRTGRRVPEDRIELGTVKVR